ncbi:DUF4145 domain-containing protein [Flavobacterium aciduliphilum]|uniref:Uncharacterized protein DUF4145 n=1 Tax=Flavobacterium aciduliphilum TaxID=1101402 RepID=A0A328YKJ7_9FLAO|nr:DUF4145 domain-containing protein [Flavobacterium aciduliphilum]RAR72602.1 uncharacterized protein DUF4145 [Flavobacterium aciduliphilum]
MKLLDEKEFKSYIEENFESIYKDVDDSTISQQIPGTCDSCSRDVFLKIYSETFNQAYYSDNGLPRFVNIFVECPNCRKKSFIFAVQFVDEKRIPHVTGGSSLVYKFSLYRLYRLPIQNENYINEDIPAKYDSLRKTATEASYCLTNSKFIASAILFRRAIQILAKSVLGAKGKTLFNQLEWLKSNQNLLAIDLTEIFHENAQIIKDIGNQGAHPDDDITLHDFTKEDANGLHDLFISIIHEIFVKPEKMKALQEELKKNRKLK